MKQDILSIILDRNNLNEAFKNVASNKGASGIDNKDIEETRAYLKEHNKEIIQSFIVVCFYSLGNYIVTRFKYI